MLQLTCCGQPTTLFQVFWIENQGSGFNAEDDLYEGGACKVQRVWVQLWLLAFGQVSQGSNSYTLVLTNRLSRSSTWFILQDVSTILARSPYILRSQPRVRHNGMQSVESRVCKIVRWSKSSSMKLFVTSEWLHYSAGSRVRVGIGQWLQLVRCANLQLRVEYFYNQRPQVPNLIGTGRGLKEWA